MEIARALPRCGFLGLVLAAGMTYGCGPNPIAPTPAPLSTGASVQFLAGVTNARVTDAQIVVGPEVYQTNQDGSIVVPFTAVGTTLEARADGFLPRRTQLSANALVRLWPVASEAEASAIRQMVFNHRNVPDQLEPYDPSVGMVVTVSRPPSSTVLDAWRTETRDFGLRFSMLGRVVTGFEYEFYNLSVVFDDTRCTPDPRLGFCRIDSLWIAYNVASDRAADPVTIRRVLASVFLGPNPFPGLLNPESPASDLSAFEEQTIRMILMRPLRTRWPDDDRR